MDRNRSNKEVTALVEWGTVLNVAFVGLTGVFAGLLLLEISANIMARVVKVVERFAPPKK